MTTMKLKRIANKGGKDSRKHIYRELDKLCELTSSEMFSILGGIGQQQQHQYTMSQLEKMGAEGKLAGITLSGYNLEGINLSGDNLQGTVFIDDDMNHADLQKANLQNAHFDGTRGDCDMLEKANLEGAILRETSWQNAQLQGANFTNDTFENDDLRGANLSYADLAFVSFTGADLSAAYLCHLSRADLTGTVINPGQGVDTNATGAHFEYSELNTLGVDGLNNVIITGDNFAHANLQTMTIRSTVSGDCGMNFKEANLSGADFCGNSFANADFDRANMCGALLDDPKSFCDADFRHADLYGSTDTSNFSGADFDHADLNAAQMEWSTLVGANLNNTKDNGANFDWTILDGVTWKKAVCNNQTTDTGAIGNLPPIP